MFYYLGKELRRRGRDRAPRKQIIIHYHLSLAATFLQDTSTRLYFIAVHSNFLSLIRNRQIADNTSLIRKLSLGGPSTSCTSSMLLTRPFEETSY
jgi:hypothetical protein